MQLIKLSFDGSIVTLAGNGFGRSTFDKHVKGKVDIYHDEVEIVFPSNIEQIASSFVQGFFTEWYDAIGIDGICQKVRITSKTYKNIQDDVFRKLM